MRRKIIFGLMFSLGFILILTAFSFINNHSKADNITLIDPDGQYFTSGYKTLIANSMGITVTIKTPLTSNMWGGTQPPSISPATVNRPVLKGNTDTFQIIATDVNFNLKTPATDGLKAFYLNAELNSTSIPKFTPTQNGNTITGIFEFNTSTFDSGTYFFVFEATDSTPLKGYAFATINVTTTPTYTLNVNSTDTGAGITVSPVDNNGDGNGTTNFTRTYNQNQVVTLTAPSTYNGKNFSNWTGVDTQNNTQATVTMTSARTATANYSSGGGGGAVCQGATGLKASPICLNIGLNTVGGQFGPNQAGTYTIPGGQKVYFVVDPVTFGIACNGFMMQVGIYDGSGFYAYKFRRYSNGSETQETQMWGNDLVRNNRPDNFNTTQFIYAVENPRTSPDTVKVYWQWLE